MPELPEVETTRRGIEPHVLNQRVERVIVRNPRLRWPIPSDLPELLCGQQITAVRRRAKYLLLETPCGTLILHLGMSGSLRVLPASSPVGKHDHLDIVLDSGLVLRLTDPRRFGAALWTDAAPAQHALLAKLGPEPLSEEFSAATLIAASRGRKQAIKTFIMNAAVVVGVGNIYASEALFRAGISPATAAGRISARRYEKLSAAIKSVLAEAIEQGGTTLRDFTQTDGQPGYFRIRLAVYGRAGESCTVCETPIKQRVIGQRSTFWCCQCQT